MPLDHVSNASIYVLRRRSRRRADDQMLKLWETAEAKTFRPTQKKKKKSVGHQFEDVEQKSDHHPSSELEVEKELVGDKLAVPTSFNEPNQAQNKRKLLERLDTNAQKFNTLQIIVNELRREIDIKQEEEEKGEEFDFGTVEEQFFFFIVQLAEVKSQLTRKTEVGHLQMDGTLSPEMGQLVICKGRECRKGFEKIRQLQLEGSENPECVVVVRRRKEKQREGKGSSN